MLFLHVFICIIHIGSKFQVWIISQVGITGEIILPEFNIKSLSLFWINETKPLLIVFTHVAIFHVIVDHVSIIESVSVLDKGSCAIAKSQNLFVLKFSDRLSSG
ncbi:hypothetical protein K9M48_02470 [Candidatus Gracilibacteria bacterium]|nr:hypothetical protein [Candidatus Gracilibacteria bacterium]